MTDLNHFVPRHPSAVCVDSDGCAMDTMNIKHFRCFGPCMITEWGLEEWREELLDRWNVINLFSATRGINRFKGLAKELAEIDRTYKSIEGIEKLREWADEAPELSNDALAAYCEAEEAAGRNCPEILKKALNWSREVNAAIRRLPEEEIHDFPGVREALAMAHEASDVAVVSSANRDAVLAEWTRFGLLPHVDLVCAQDTGSKAYCVKQLRQKGYARDRLLLCGDAPGDLQAAISGDSLFYPILVGMEAESWAEFRREALPRFYAGTFDGAYQEELIRRFKENLQR